MSGHGRRREGREREGGEGTGKEGKIDGGRRQGKEGEEGGRKEEEQQVLYSKQGPNRRRVGNKMCVVAAVFWRWGKIKKLWCAAGKKRRPLEGASIGVK